MTTTEMREPTFFVLASLADGRKHGYGIIKDAAALSDGRVSLKVGTLYAALDRLQAEGLVEPAGDEVVDGRNRRYFELTEDGAGALAVESERQELNARRARTRLIQRAVRAAATGASKATGGTGATGPSAATLASGASVLRASNSAVIA